MKKLLVLLAAASLWLAVSANARVPIGTLAGTVLNVHDQPVVHAAVTIQTSDGREPYATHTDSRGHFSITRLETGQYDLRASSAGRISEWTKRVMVHANKTTTVVIHLPAEKR
jgi:hypothetical protein